MAKKKAGLTPIPESKPAKASTKPVAGRKKTAAAAEAPPDLSYIAERLRPLAVPVAQVTFHPCNPNKHDEKSIAGIRASLRANGQYKPIVASTRTEPWTVVCGNGTLAAVLAENRAYIAVVPEKYTKAKENQIAIIDKRTADLSDWDDGNLKDLLADVDTGNDEDIDKMLSELAEDQGLIPDDDQGGGSSGTKGSADLTAKLKCPHCGGEFEAP